MAFALGREPLPPVGQGRCLFVTAHHVVSLAQDVYLSRWSPLPNRPAEVIGRAVASFPEFDTALIATDGDDNCPAPPSFQPRPAPRDDIVTLGQYDLYQGAVTKGVVAGYGILPPWPIPIIRSDVRVQPGFSGGVALNSNGQAVGMVIARSVDPMGLSTIAPVCDLLAQVPGNFQVLATPPAPATPKNDN